MTSLPTGRRAARLPLLRFALLAAAGAALWLASPAKAATYKWVDEKGVVHYTDKIPTEAVNKGSTVLDKQARPLKKIEPAATPEQIRAREAEEEQRKLLAKVQEEMSRRDRALLASYTNEAEIELARSRALLTIDSQIQSAQAYVTLLVRRKEELDKRRAALGDKPMPVALEREFEGTDSELGKQTVLIDQKQRERAIVIAKYDADKVRYRELRAIAESNAAAAAGQQRSHPAAIAPTSASSGVSAGAGAGASPGAASGTRK